MVGAGEENAQHIPTIRNKQSLLYMSPAAGEHLLINYVASKDTHSFTNSSRQHASKRPLSGATETCVQYLCTVGSEERLNLSPLRGTISNSDNNSPFVDLDPVCSTKNQTD